MKRSVFRVSKEEEYILVYKDGKQAQFLPGTVEVFVCLSLLFKSQLEASVPWKQEKELFLW